MRRLVKNRFKQLAESLRSLFGLRVPFFEKGGGGVFYQTDLGLRFLMRERQSTAGCPNGSRVLFQIDDAVFKIVSIVQALA